MKQVLRIFILLIPVCCILISSCGQKAGVSADPAKDARMEWWREARFGMFIHWGIYAVPAGVWKGEEIRGIGEWIMNRAQIPVSFSI